LQHASKPVSRQSASLDDARADQVQGDARAAVGAAVAVLDHPRRLEGGPGRQYAALPYRQQDGLEILLISSRETRRWVIPKGWPMKGKKPHATAAREALEEAGVVGAISKQALGAFQYVKRLKNGAPLLCTVDVFPLLVSVQRPHWPEQHQRTTQWFSAAEAAVAVDEPELRELIERFAATAPVPGAIE
jgi:8-oxo-dGTP pyrophosphatase MutT (NUDIX family)